MRTTVQRPRETGFTLIELLIVVAVIGIIAAIAIPNLLSAIQRSRQSRTVADIRMISEGVEAYQNDHSFYPLVSNGTVAELAADLEIYIRKFNDLDGWGEPIFFDSDGSHYTVISFGWDGHSTLPYVNGPTNNYDADIVFTDGNFLQWPEGPQTQ
jgi:general secretion pathway protein G